MHGLNTTQRIDFIAAINARYGVGTVYGTQNLTLQCYTPSILNTMIPSLITNIDRQFWLKRMYRQFTFTNVGMFPIYMEVNTYIARKDQVETLETWMNDDIVGSTGTSPASIMPFISINTSDTFRRYWKVLGKKTFLMRPMRPYQVKVGIPSFLKRKAITGETEANTSYFYRKGAIVKYVRWYGIPNHWDRSDGVALQTGLTPVLIRGFYKTYCSYYAMDDATSNSEVSFGNTPFTGQSTAYNTAWNPTYLMAGMDFDPGTLVTTNVIAPPVVHANGQVTPPT